MDQSFKEHSKSDKKSAVRERILSTRHSIIFEDVMILASEPRPNARKIREAFEAYKGKLTLNKDQGVISKLSSKSPLCAVFKVLDQVSDIINFKVLIL